MTDLTFRPLRPEEDAALVHGWVTQPRGRFWGMADKSVEEVRDIYAFVDSLEAHWAWIGESDGRPVALVQTYEPEHDPIAQAYDVQPGDLGAHIFVAPGQDADPGRQDLPDALQPDGTARVVGAGAPDVGRQVDERLDVDEGHRDVPVARRAAHA